MGNSRPPASASSESAPKVQSYWDLVKETLEELKDPKGSSRRALSNAISMKKDFFNNLLLNKTLSKAVESGKLIQIRQSFKLPKEVTKKKTTTKTSISSKPAAVAKKKTLSKANSRAKTTTSTTKAKKKTSTNTKAKTKANPATKTKTTSKSKAKSITKTKAKTITKTTTTAKAVAISQVTTKKTKKAPQSKAGRPKSSKK